MAGRIGFAIGRVGSIQDIAVEGQPIDDDLQLQSGMPFIGGNWGYAKIVRQNDAGELNFTNFGSDDNVDGYFTGASDRYSVVIDSIDNEWEVELRADLIGDAARLRWQIQNLSDESSRLGLWFGQWVVGMGPTTQSQLGQGMHYVRVPGRRPLQVDTRFARNPSSGVFPIENPMPDKIDFGLTQSWAYGLQVINLPTEGANSALNDQTPVDGLDVGDAGVFRSPSLLGPMFAGNGRPMSPTYSRLWPDVFFTAPANSIIPDGSGYIQKWDPQPVGDGDDPNRFRTIVAYYKSTTGTSDYAKPYSAVIDAPRTVGVLDNNPNQFNPAVSTVRVYIDNTRGFSTVGEPITLNDVRITLKLPTGMSDANNPASREITKFIDRVEPNNAQNIDPSDPIEFVDFQVRINPETFGTQFYTVEIQPQPGASKTITGSINVASQPRLGIVGPLQTGGQPVANLVTAPWQFTNSTWATILGGGPDPLQQDVDYQAFAWDAQKQEYVVQTSPQRGIGTWIISNKNVGSKQLGGNPRTPNDLATGAPLIALRSGWNLIANPYNYPIELGQIVGVTDADPTDAQTFEELAAQGIISSSLAYWDQVTQSYKFTVGFSDEMLPNRGYWIFVSTTQDVTLSYPPVFTPFVPSGSGGIENAAGWRLNLTARSAQGISDNQNVVGIAANQEQALKTRIMEPPVAPVKGAVSAAIVEGNMRLARSLRPKTSRMEWRYEVTPRENGTVTVGWPDASQLPSNLRVQIVDASTGTTYDPKKVKSVAFFGRANRTQAFRVIAENSVAPAVLSSATASSTTSSAAIRYTLGESARTSVRILQNGRPVVNLTTGRSDVPGSKMVSWNLRDTTGRRVRPGVFVAEITATANGKTEMKTASFLVR
ncbi:MAG: hypothetical protein ACO1SV_03275 [Fimbriimonas sp.]